MKAMYKIPRCHYQRVFKLEISLIRLIFFATAFGSETEKAKPLRNLLGLLTANNIYHLQVSKFVHSWHKGCLPEVFDNIFQYASNISIATTRDIQLTKIFIS